MCDKDFGKLLEKLIHFSSQKNYSLAMTLGYDVSYISKWINQSTLPTSKNIENINNKISEFIVDSSSELSLQNIINYFGFEINKDTDAREELKAKIEQSLNKAYLYSYNKHNKKNKKKTNDRNNSVQISNPSFVKNYLNDEISSFILESGSLEIIVLCNLFSLNTEDKLRIAGIEDKHKNKQFDFNAIDMTYLLSFDENVKDLILDMSLFIYMVISKKRLRNKIYSCGFSSNTFISAVKNKCSHTAIFDNNNKCLMAITSTDTKAVDDVYKTLDNMKISQSKRTFSIITPEKMILSQENMNYIINDKIKLLAGEITELLMPSDLFLEIGKQVFECDEQIIDKLKKIDMLLKTLTYDSKIDIILYESVFRKYIYNGKMTFFNKPVTLTVNQRKKHIEYMKTILQEKNNISVNLLDNSILDNYKEDERIFLSISRDNTFLKEYDNGITRNYLKVNDNKLERIMKNFFNELWDKNKKDDDKNKLIKLIDSSIKYLKVYNEI